MEVSSLEFLPDQLPTPIQRDRLSPELLRSSTIESLISQNEDLMVRLKVTLRRLSLLEVENQKSYSENLKEKQSAAQANDRLLVMKEKESIWKTKIDDLENSQQTFQEKWLKLSSIYQTTKTQVERLQKYHDRIRHHVKPFVQELKKYSKALEVRNQELQETLDKKEAHLSDLKFQILEISKNSKQQISILEQKNWQVTEHFEMLNQQLTVEASQLKELNSSLGEKAERLQIFKERADQLENENIELRRNSELNLDRHQAEIIVIQNQFQTQSSEVTRLNIEHKDSKDRLMEEFELRKSLEKQVFDLRHQLDSLRFMWNAKNDENDKLRQTQGALEKLNVDLSAKFQEFRKSENQIPDQTTGLLESITSASGV